MKSILSTAVVLLLGTQHVAAEYPAKALYYRGLNALTYEGCYSSEGSMSMDSTYLYQTKGWCQGICVGKNKAVQATSNGNECWCGDEMPPKSAKVDQSKCNSKCAGYGTEMCTLSLFLDTGPLTNLMINRWCRWFLFCLPHRNNRGCSRFEFFQAIQVFLK